MGDVFLELQEMDGWDNLFVCGLGSFLFGHVLFARAYASGEFTFKAKFILPPLLFSGAMIGILLPNIEEKDLKIPVAVYAAVIAMMAASAMCRKCGDPSSSERFAFSWKAGTFGAWIFVLSDTLIAVNKFLFPLPNAKIFIMITYYTAQLLIALSARGAVPKSRSA